VGLNVNILANGVFLISFPSAIYNLSSFVFFPSLPLSSIGALVVLVLWHYSCSSFLFFVMFLFLLSFVDSVYSIIRLITRNWVGINSNLEDTRPKFVRSWFILSMQFLSLPSNSLRRLTLPTIILRYCLCYHICHQGSPSKFLNPNPHLPDTLLMV